MVDWNETLAVNLFFQAFVPEKSISVPSSSSSSWVVSPSAQIEYEKMFFKIDQDKDGLVSGIQNIYV